MDDNKIQNDLAEIKEAIGRLQRRTDVQWIYNLGFVGVWGALALQAVNAPSLAVLGVLVVGILLMLSSPILVRRKRAEAHG